MVEKKPGFFYGYVVVALACLVLAVIQGTFFSFGVFFKPLAEGFGWTRAMTAGALGLNLVLHGLLFIIAGRITDRFGPRIVLTVCGFILGIGYLLMSQIGAIWQLYLVYGVIIAIGISGGFVPMMSTTSRWFVKKRGLANGVVSAGVGLGMLFMPLFSNWLISSYNWRNSFIIIGIASLVILALAAQFLKRDPAEVGQLPDGEAGGTIERASFEPGGLTLRQVIGTVNLWVFCLACFSWAFGAFSIITHIVPHATDLGISEVVAASILGIIGGAGFVGRIAIGAVADRVGTRLAYLFSLFLLGSAFVILFFATEVWLFYLVGVTLGLGFGGVCALYGSMVADLFGLKSHGVILGIAVASDAFGGAVGSVVAGGIFDVTGSYFWHIWACLILAILGFILISILKPPFYRDEGVHH